jgi:hypothetical protein
VCPEVSKFGMPPATFSDEDFLGLWMIHGQNWTWNQYAEELGVKAVALRARASRSRDVWRTVYGIDVAMKRTDTKVMFAAWPDAARRDRDVWPVRFLEAEAVTRERGEDALSVQALQRWRSYRTKLLSEDKVIRYDPGKGFYRSSRLPHEPEGIIAEPRESYLNRHPDAREEE